jgi:hypothetical protein
MINYRHKLFFRGDIQTKLEFLSARSGVLVGRSSVFIHPTVQYHLSGSAIRLILNGHMEDSNSFYGIADVNVQGWWAFNY